jgi:EmrB/QacA subfamily drug resistance transporter
VNPPAPVTGSRKRLVLACVLLSMVLAAIDETIVGTALPTIVADLGGGAHLGWVVTAYLLAEIVTKVLAGRFGDLFGRRVVLVTGLAVFVAGSLSSGFAQNMGMLVACRAVQGLGAGAMSVTAAALLGETVTLRERAKYQGIFGAVLGAATVIGPLAGGVLSQYLGWRWTFWVGAPIAAATIALAVAAVPARTTRTPVRIDYLGLTLISLAATGLTLVASWGGSIQPWASPTIIGLIAASAVALALFVVVEKRAAAPILPLRLFRDRVFTTAAVLSFVVGLTMTGSVTFLPTFLQFVTGATVTESGLGLLPEVVGVAVTSIAAGWLMGRTGRYRVFPILGAALIGTSLFLLSLTDQNTPYWVEAIPMLGLGIGIGMTIQLLTTIVQNSAPFADLGAATSGVSFLRTLGGAFGASIFGGIYAGQLADRLPGATAGLPDPALASEPLALATLPSAARAAVVTAHADSLQHVFLSVVPLAGLAVLVALLMPQVRLRGAGTGATPSTGHANPLPRSASPHGHLEDMVGGLLHRGGGRTPDAVLAESGLDAAELGALARVLVAQERGEPLRRSEIDADPLLTRGLIVPAGDRVAISGAGDEQLRAVEKAWRRHLRDRLRDWLPGERDPEGEAALGRVVARLVREAGGQEDRVPVPR